MIEVTNLTRRYGSVTAGDRVSFRLGRGEIVGLLGHNEAGKSTIMKMLTGFLEPSAGQIRITGEDLQEDHRRAQSRIGYLPENCPLYPEMSVVDFLDYTATLRGLPEAERPVAETDAASKRIKVADADYQRRLRFKAGDRQLATLLLGGERCYLIALTKKSLRFATSTFTGIFANCHHLSAKPLNLFPVPPTRLMPPIQPVGQLLRVAALGGTELP